ncbi:MAG: DUF262 domain-containing protein [Desulfomonilaceae bacterium]
MSYIPRSLFRLLEDIDGNRLFLPHIQRPFVWQRDRMERLFDSVMRDYPIQTFLFWRTNEEIRARRFMRIIDFDANLSEYYDLAKSKCGVEKIFVLDGQQRLQTFHGLFRGGVKEDSVHIGEAYFDVTAGGTEVENGDLLYQLFFSVNRLNPPMFRIKDLSEQYVNKNPMNIADDLNDSLDCHLEESPEQRKMRQHQVRFNLQQLYSILHHDKHLWIDELDGVAHSYPYRQILEIFVRVNSGGTKLSAGDLMFAAMKEGWDDIEVQVEQTVDLLNGGKLNMDADFVLKCLLLVHGEGAEIKTEKFIGTRGEGLIERIERSWDQSEKAFQQLRDFMVQTVRVESDRLIRSYNALIPLFDFFFHNPQPDEINRQLMAAYNYKAQLFNWFSRQTDGVLNVLHNIVGKPQDGRFPLNDIKSYFTGSRGAIAELGQNHLLDIRLRSMILNIVYTDRWGANPFNVAYKGHEPHVDHIYPQYMLRSQLHCESPEINDIGNLRFIGATDNIRKRAELPDDYFSRLKDQRIPIEKHLLVEKYAANPKELRFDKNTFDTFREARRLEIWKSVKKVVDPELTT